jgi:hypothetical protein
MYIPLYISIDTVFMNSDCMYDHKVCTRRVIDPDLKDCHFFSSIEEPFLKVKTLNQHIKI